MPGSYPLWAHQAHGLSDNVKPAGAGSQTSRARKTVRAILQALLGSAVRRLQVTELKGDPQEAGIGQENPAGPEHHRGEVTPD
jgi:hypothetical protein